ncbi:MAG: SAM-dependent DNA methyltransferase, partial [Planctomycetes bacterium]|nr:SAM-dependent DNA methyltransferase [Planctomycetota bacterium]
AKLAAHYHLTGGEPAPLLFAVHTYYAVLMKFLAAEIASTFSPLGTSVLKKCAGAATNAQLRRDMAQLEQGGIWTQLGITNFLEGDLFSWYLGAWTDEVAEAVRSIARTLDDYDPATLSVEPTESRDLLKQLYQHLFPKSVRHDLGEYYTPDWLAEHVLNEVGYNGDPDKRILDPACGSGTFLVMAVNRVKRWFEEHAHECGFGEKELIAKVQTNVIGFDLNPLAVMAARTNYLLAVRSVLKFAPRLEIPVYLCDSIMTPAEHGELFAGRGARKLRTAAGEFIIPGEIAADRQRVARYADTLEACISSGYTVSDFLARCQDQGLPVAERQLHTELYEQLRLLEAKDQNGIWARIIKNAFAPLFVGRVDFVAGNPPWVNWEHLPEDYRDSIKPLWERYGLFTLGPSAARLGGGKKDLSMLFTYSAVDNYLEDGGRLGFVITQTVFKTKGAGDGFRRLQFGRGKGRVVLRPVSVHDMSDFQPFEAATNRTAVFLCERHRRAFRYPVRYVAWRKRRAVARDATLDEVVAACDRREMRAVPVDQQAGTSPWLTAPPKALSGIKKVLGKSGYQAIAGCCSWLNGVYWVRVLQELPDGHVLIQNLHRVGKIRVEHIRWTVESALVYPLLRGRDVVRWCAQPVAHVLLVQDPEKRSGIPEALMRRRYPKAFAYLKHFETQLRERSGYRKYYQPSDPFYSMYDVSEGTLAPWKVVWRDMGDTIQAAAMDKPDCRPIVPEHHVMMVPFTEARSAYYLAGALGSSPVKLAVASYTLTTGISAHVLEHIAVPAFRPSDTVHLRFADLSRQCHAARATNDTVTLGALEAEIDQAAAELWGITAAELEAIQAALKET